MEKIFEHSAAGEAKHLKAKRAKRFKDSMNKESLDCLYVCYTVNVNTLFSQVEHSNFWVFF